MVIDLNQCSDGSMGQIYARNGSTGQISEATKGQQEMLNANAKLCEQKKESTEGLKTLGILFVHGIGEQRRGDTLVQCTAAIYGWMRQWINPPLPFTQEGFNAVELLDTYLTQPRADEPAHSRLIFRTDETIAPHSWILAESCWAEVFRPPGYREFVRWAVRVIPLTFILHLLKSFRRNLRIMQKGMLVYDRRSNLDDLKQLQSDLGPEYGPLPSTDADARKFFLVQSSRASTRWLISPLVIAVMLFVAILVQAMLLATIVIGSLPIGFIKSFVGYVQKKVAAVLGDSYLFVESPITVSAVVTQVKKDFEWLAERCDEVIILAHSQGAAIAYRTIEEWSWEDKIPPKLKLLITYGSGLQKLFDLQQLSRNRSPEEMVNIKRAIALIALGSIGIVTIGLWAVGLIPLLPAALSFFVGFVVLMLGLFLADTAFGQSAPRPVSAIECMNFFASHDPVSNGQLVFQPEPISTGNALLDKIFVEASRELGEFSQWDQRQVVNLQSTIADHTTYWSAQDDFVSRIVAELLRRSNFGLAKTIDDEWLQAIAQRRLWRVGLRTACRNVAILAAFYIIFLSPKTIHALGVGTNNAMLGALAYVPKALVPDWIRSAIIAAPTLSGTSALLGGICSMFAVAIVGWNMWQRREFAQFLCREPFRARGVGLALFTFGWIGVVLVTPALATFAVRQAFWPSLWSLSSLLIVTCWTLVKGGKGPNPSMFLSLQERIKLTDAKFPPVLRPFQSRYPARTRAYLSWAEQRLLHREESLEKVQRLLDLAGVFEQGQPRSEYSYDEKPGIQAIATTARVRSEPLT